ncbi:HTH_Tnp_Tc3_2 domain-containing protein [Trichonephila clavipes]|nr:HTH_Tnp_Tc3_2 domain-containing protein [Trichonephila clavipes]
MLRRSLRPYYKQLSEFERGRIIGLKEKRHEGSGRPRAAADREDRLIVKSAVTAPDSSLSTIRRATRTRVPIHRWLIEENLRSNRPLYHLPFTPVPVEPYYRGAWLDQRYIYTPSVRRGPSENCFATVPFAVPCLIFQQDNARPHTTRVVMQCLTAGKTLFWPARFLSNRACQRCVMGRRLYLPVNNDDLVRQLEQIWQKIPQDALSLFATSCGSLHLARVGSTPY